MDPRLQKRVQRYGWDRASAHYDNSWAAQLEPAQTRMLERAELRSGEAVLDTACGTGLVSFRVAELVGPRGRVVGTDIAEEMVKACGERAARDGLDHVRFERMDAEALALDDATFDAGLCGLGLMYCPSPVVALKEMRRVLKPGGRAAVAVWGARDRCGWAEIFPIVDSRVNTEVCPLFFQLGTGDALQYTMEAAELVDLTIDRLSTTLYYETAEAAYRAVFEAGPVAMAYSRFDDDTRSEAHTEYLESIEPFRKDRGYEIPGEFVIGRGTRA